MRDLGHCRSRTPRGDGGTRLTGSMRLRVCFAAWMQCRRTRSQRPPSCLIVGCGYVGTRLARRESRPTAAPRDRAVGPERDRACSRAGILTMRLDLDAPASQRCSRSLAAAARDVGHRLPRAPARRGHDRPATRIVPDDSSATRRRRCSSTSARPASTATREARSSTRRRRSRPATDRARRRVAAESAVTAWCAARGVRCVILRVPGIYGPHRLPLDRLQRGEPALRQRRCRARQSHSRRRPRERPSSRRSTTGRARARTTSSTAIIRARRCTCRRRPRPLACRHRDSCRKPRRRRKSRPACSRSSPSRAA